MTGLTTYMWKEWRDQRVQVLGYALLVPVLMTIALLAIPGEWARMDAMPTFVAIGGLLIGALTIASDCVPGELRRGRLEFLARLPCDLRTPFVAKVIFVALALAGFCVYAWFCATTLSAALAGGNWFSPFEWTFQNRIENAYESRLMSWSMLDPLIVLSAWIFAVSCWLPRGTLALPAAAIAIALIGGPTALVVLEHHGLMLHREELTALRLWLPATALLAAALSFLRGSRHGRAPLRMAAWTIFGTLFAATPVWAWTANRWHDYVDLDLKSDSLALAPVALGDGGRYLFANVRPRIRRYGGVVEDEASRPVVVDLDAGVARAAGPIETMFDPRSRHSPLATAPLVLVLAADPIRTRAELFGSLALAPIEWSDGFDGRSGTHLSGEQWKALLTSKVSICDSIVRASDFVLMADGTRCWMTGRTLHLTARDGATTTWECKEAPAEFIWWQPCGAGFQIGWNGGFVDVAMRRFVSGPSVERTLSKAVTGSEAVTGGRVLAIRADGWLVQQWHRPVRGRDPLKTVQEYALWSPGETAVRPVVGLRADEWIVAPLPDGRVLTTPRQDDGAASRTELELSLVDPSTGVRSLVARPAGLSAPKSISFRGLFPSGAVVAFLQWPLAGRDWPTRAARIGADGAMQVTAILPSAANVIGCPDEATIVLLNEEHIVLRARFDGSPCEVLFPRDEARR